MTTQRPAVIVDFFERFSGIPGLLETHGVEVQRRRLPTGDYDVGRGTLIERKSVLDLSQSLFHGRLWLQLRRLRQESSFPVLLIEGDQAELALTAQQKRGLLLAIADQGIVIASSTDPEDSAAWIATLARRRQARVPRNRPPYSRRAKSPQPAAAEAVIAAIAGLSVNCAHALLARFNTVRGVIEAPPSDWITVPGIGPVRARAIEQALMQPPHLDEAPQ